MGAKDCDNRVCLSVCRLAYLKNDTSKLHECSVHVTYVAVAWSSSDDNVIRYILAVLMMFAPTGRLVTPRGSECTRPPPALWRLYSLFASTTLAADDCIHRRKR